MDKIETILLCCVKYYNFKNILNTSAVVVLQVQVIDKAGQKLRKRVLFTDITIKEREGGS